MAILSIVIAMAASAEAFVRSMRLNARAASGERLRVVDYVPVYILLAVAAAAATWAL